MNAIGTTEKFCQNCAFMFCHNAEEKKHTCHFNPPILMQVEALDIISTWPDVPLENFCSKFKLNTTIAENEIERIWWKYRNELDNAETEINELKKKNKILRKEKKIEQDRTGTNKDGPENGI